MRVLLQAARHQSIGMPEVPKVSGCTVEAALTDASKLPDHRVERKAEIGKALRAMKPGQTVVIPEAIADKRTARARAYQLLGPGNYRTRSIEGGLLIWLSAPHGGRDE